MQAGGRVDRREQRIDRGGLGPGAGRHQHAAAKALRQLARLATKARRSPLVEHVGAAAAADQDGHERPRQVCQARLPPERRIGQTLGRHAVQGQQVVQDVGGLGQPVLRRGDHQIEALDRSPGPAEQDQAGPAAGLAPDPARDGLVALVRQDDDIGPRRLERIGALAIDAQQVLAAQELQGGAERAMRDPLDLVWAAQRLGQCQQLRALARPRRRQHPHTWCRVGRERGRARRPEPGGRGCARGAQGGGGTQRHHHTRAKCLSCGAGELVTRHTWRGVSPAPTH